MDNCRFCGNKLGSNFKRCKICHYYFCEGCTHVEKTTFLIFKGKRYCLSCWTVLTDSKEDAVNKRDSIMTLSRYIESGNIPDDVLVDQAKILSLTESMKTKRTDKNPRESNYEKLPEGYNPNEDFPKIFNEDHEKAYELQVNYLIEDDYYTTVHKKPEVSSFPRINPRPQENFPPPYVNYPNQVFFQAPNLEKPKNDLYPAPFELEDNSSINLKPFNPVPKQEICQPPPNIPLLSNQGLNHPSSIPPQLNQELYHAPSIPPSLKLEADHPLIIPPQINQEFYRSPSIPPPLKLEADHFSIAPPQVNQEFYRPPSIPPPLKLEVDPVPSMILPINQGLNHPSSIPPPLNQVLNNPSGIFLPLNQGLNYPPPNPQFPGSYNYNDILEDKVPIPTTTQNYNNNMMNNYYKPPIYEQKVNISSNKTSQIISNPSLNQHVSPSIIPSAPNLPVNYECLPINNHESYSILPQLNQTPQSQFLNQPTYSQLNQPTPQPRVDNISIPPPLPKQAFQPIPLLEKSETHISISQPPPLITSIPTQNPDPLPVFVPMAKIPSDSSLKNKEEIKAKPLPAAKTERANDQAKNIRISVFIPTQFKNADPLKLFKLHKRIGNGSSGEIHIAEKLLTKEIFAAKIINPKTDHERELVINEISLTQNSNHPNIIKYLEYYDHKNSIWIIEELMSCSLTDLILDCPGKIPENVLKYILYEVLKGLNYLHKRNRIHRDMKSDNILISENGEIKIADLGFAAQLDDIRKARSTFAGTLLWMPPEILQQNSYGIKADVWSLGIVGIELAEGEPPHYSETQHNIVSRIINQSPPELKEKDRWSWEFDDFTGKCLVKDPSFRMCTEELLKHVFFADAEMHRESFIKYFQEWSNSR